MSISTSKSFGTRTEDQHLDHVLHLLITTYLVENFAVINANYVPCSVNKWKKETEEIEPNVIWFDQHTLRDNNRRELLHCEGKKQSARTASL